MKRIFCDFDKKQHKIKAQHGLCNYPVSYNRYDGEPNRTTSKIVYDIFEEINTPVIRLKDQRHKGYGKCLEVPFIFRDFKKDENDPANYYFYNTDASIKSSVAVCDKVMIRLGAPREYFAPLHSKVADDREKFAAICCNIIRHINDGWAKGMHAGVKYFEIWNRADDIKCWQKSYEEYYQLYEVCARAIKKLHPRLKVGGPAAADCSGDNKFLKGFLEYVAKNDVPCDFVSWNYYGEDPAEALTIAKNVRSAVFAAKLPKRVEIINDEWNCMTIGEDGRVKTQNTRNMHGAAFDAAFMINMHKARMDFCTYYECQPFVPWGGLVHPGWTYAYKTLYAFLAFARVYNIGGTSVKTNTAGKNVYALAADNGEKKMMLVSIYQGKRDTVQINTGISGSKTVYLLDENNDLTEVLTTWDESFYVKTSGYSVLLVEIK